MTKIIYLFTVLTILFAGCEEVERGIPIDKNDMAPPQVTNVEVENIPGGAIITYELPKSDHLLYVMAEYQLNNGKTVEKKTSFYDNTIKLEGFADTTEYNVNLFSVSRGGKKSAALSVLVHPLTSPVLTTFGSVDLKPTFGGIKVSFENESEADLRIYVLSTDSLGELYTPEIFYTKRKSGVFAVRGFINEERPFGVYVMDRWDNSSDTLFANLTPWFEEELDKDNFKALKLPTDTWEQHMLQGSIESVWDGIWNVQQPVFHTKPNTGIPQWFTMDLGVTARLSRFKFHHRLAASNGNGNDGQYSAGDPKIIEVYGSNDPADDGSWDGWDLLGSFESIKPSGADRWTDEDIQYACVVGEDFEFEVENSYRYLRIKVLKNWGGVSYTYFSELTFWGEINE